MIRCCICRAPDEGGTCRPKQPLEPTALPGGYRCTDHTACQERVRGIVAAHVGLGEMCE